MFFSDTRTLIHLPSELSIERDIMQTPKDAVQSVTVGTGSPTNSFAANFTMVAPMFDNSQETR